MAVRYLAVSAAAVYCIDIVIDYPIIAMVRFQYPKFWSAINVWFKSLECATGSSQLVPPSELSAWSVQDLANSVLIKLRQSVECESLFEVSWLGILKNKPMRILTNKFLSLLFWCYFDSTEPHHYCMYIDCFCSLNIKLVFRYKNHFVLHCCLSFALKFLFFLIILIIRYNQIVFQIYFPFIFPLAFPIISKIISH